MDNASIKATIMVLAEESQKPHPSDSKMSALAFNLLEHFLLEQHRQTELLDYISHNIETLVNIKLRR